MPDITIDENLFAHINTDPFLKGSFGLEGNRFANTIGYLAQYVEQAQQNNASESESVKELMRVCSNLSSLETKMHKEFANLAEIAQDIQKKAFQLGRKKFLLLPGGWVSKSGGGHAMIYQIKKDDHDDVFFCIHNTGSGLEFHEKCSEEEKEKYNAVLTYKIPNEKINDVNFVSIITELLKIQIRALSTKDVDAKYLYQAILPKMIYVGGKIVQNSSEDSQYTAGQLSGTCTQRSLHAMLKKCFKNLDEYRQFIYGFKAYSLDDYYKINKEKLTPKNVGQLKKAIKHQLRLLNLKNKTQKEKDLFSKKYKEEQIKKLTTYLNELRTLEKVEPQQLKWENTCQPHQLHIDNPRPVAMESFQLRVPEAMPEPLKITGNNLLSELDNIILNCEKHKSAGRYDYIYEQTEYLFTGLPTPKNSFESPLHPFYNNLKSDDDVLAFYQKLNVLQLYYWESCAKHLGKETTIPNMYLVKLSLLAVVAHIDAHKKISINSTPYHSYLGGFLRYTTIEYSKATHFATNSPMFDKRLKDIQALYMKSNLIKYCSQGEIPYYQGIIDKFTSLKEDLEKRYLNKKSPLDFYLRQNGATSLDYLINHFEDIRYKKEYQPLLKKFHQQHEMERLYTTGHQYLAGNLMDRNTEFKIQNSLLNKIELQFRRSDWKKEGLDLLTLTYNIPALRPTGPLRNDKYNIQSQAIINSFGKDVKKASSYRAIIPLADNVIQIVPAEILEQSTDSFPLDEIKKIHIDRTDIENRELFHLRQAPAAQILLSLDYFNLHPQKLVATDFQRYLEANLFEPGLLRDILENTEKSNVFYKRFYSFIDSGLKYSGVSGTLTQQSLFYIRLAYLVHQYANDVNPSKFNQALNNFYKKLNSLISMQTDPMIQATLHYYRFLSLSRNEVYSDDALQDVVISFFNCNRMRNPGHLLDLDSQIKFNHTKNNFKKILQSQIKRLDRTFIAKIFAQLHPGISMEGFEIDGQYPIFDVRKNNTLYLLDIEKGLLIKNGLAQKATPPDIFNHPIAKKFGLSQPMCFVPANEDVFTLGEPEQLRFIRHKTGYRVQKKWKGSKEQEQWYELVTTSNEQNMFWQVENATASKISLSKILTERESLLWKSIDDASFLISGLDNTIEYEGDNNGNRQTNNIKNVRNGRVLNDIDAATKKKLQEFEDLNFVDVWAKHESQEQLIELKRYGIQFIKNEQNLSFTWDNMAYHLQEGKHHLGHGVAQLSFINNQQQEICVVPAQRFLNTGERSSTHEYYQLQHDIKGKIQEHICTENLHLQQRQSWQYTNSEQFIVFKMQHGKPEPKTTTEALYLCYLYLATNQPKKAFDVLEDCEKRLGGMSGTYEEMKYLSWIISGLPYKITDQDANATISTPAYVSCKLKALGIYTQFCKLDKEIPFPKPDESPQSVNALIKNDEIETVLAFKNTVTDDIYKLYTRLQSMRRELSAYFNLSQTESRSLLDFYHKNSGSKALGALGYEWVQLNLSLVYQEWAQLKVKQNKTAFEHRRIAEINEFIKKHQGVAKKTSEIRYVPLSLSLDGAYLKQTGSAAALVDELIKNASKTPAPTIEKQEQAMKKLKLGITDDDFLNDMVTYIYIAKTDNSALKKQLLDFCKATLIANRHVPLIRQQDNLTLFANILYRISHTQESAQDIFKEVNSTYGLISYLKWHKNQAPEIGIPELVDITFKNWSTAQTIWSKCERLAPRLEPTIPLAISIKTEEWLTGNFLNDKRDWRNIEAQFLTGKGAFGESTSHSDFNHIFKDEECKAGVLKYQALQALRALANKSLESPEQQKKLEQIGQAKEEKLSAELGDLQKRILQLGNEGPQDEILKQAWKTDVFSGKRKALALNDLLRLYANADSQNYANNTGLDSGKINLLHGLLAQFVALSTQHKQITRTLSQLKKISTTPIEERPQAYFLLAKTLFATNQVDVVKEPAISLFQYHADILVHQQQVHVLNRLFATSSDEQFAETIEKVIMGGGKSKVILPSIAHKKARGDNLVLIEVPKSLLRTNYIDLKATSSQLFNQDVHLLEFNRDSQATATRLEEIYNELIDVMVNKQYLVTTGDTLQSFELKYLELLMDKSPANAEEWANQVLWAERIVLLLRNRGDLIIDEAHQGLQSKFKLNYTLSDPTSIPKPILQYAIALYQCFSNVKFGSSTLSQALTDRKIPDRKTSEEATKALLQYVLSSENSPLFAEISEFAKLTSLQNVQEKLTAYLSNEGQDIPDFVKKASLETQEKIGFYKAQFAKKTGLMTFTLSQQQGEHYGPSHLTSRTPAEKMVAKPYFSNNQPKERSEFGNVIESVNYTIQSLMITGISKNLLATALNSWLSQARLEVSNGDFISLDATPIASWYRRLVGPSFKPGFGQIDTKNVQQIEKLHELLSHNQAFIYEVLKENVLPNIKANEEILRSDNFAHVNLVKSCQGVTGTPWNHTTFHQRLHLSEESAKGTDSYILQAINDKEPAIRGIDFTNTNDFIASLFNSYESKDTVRAVIDISASFKGIENLHVAKEIGAYIHANSHKFSSEKSLKYVLFFNEHNELSALRVQEHMAQQTSIVLGSSDPLVINKILGCEPEDRFTYYDQAHTLGTDIKQSPHCKAIALIDQNTQMQHFLQGNLRMRDLIEGNQSIDLVVPSTLAKKPLKELAAQMMFNEQQQLQRDNYEATRSKLSNLIRNDLMNRLLQMKGDNLAAKKDFLATVREYFVEIQSLDLFALYGDVIKEQPTEKILKGFAENLMSRWEDLLQKAKIQVGPNEREQLQKEMDAIVQGALKKDFCAPTQMAKDISQALEVEAQQQKETQVEIQLQKETQIELYDAQARSNNYKKWGNSYKYNNLTMKKLTEICASTKDKNTPKFSDNIRASENFYITKYQQENFVNMYLKPVHAILFEKTNYDGSLKCTLLTQKEYEEIQTSVDKVQDGSVWISTTQHTELAGKMPGDVKNNPEYRTILEQICYFNGELKLLIDGVVPVCWLEDESDKKLDFFVKNIWPCHETLDVEVITIKKSLSQRNKLLKLFSKEPWKDYRDEDWKEKDHSLQPDEIQSLQRLSKALYQLTSSWQMSFTVHEEELSKLRKQYHLSLTEMTYFDSYAEKLTALKSFLSSFSRDLEIALKGSEFTTRSTPRGLGERHFSILSMMYPELNQLISTEAHDEAFNCKFLILLSTKNPLLFQNKIIKQAIRFYGDELEQYCRPNDKHNDFLLLMAESMDFGEALDKLFKYVDSNPNMSEGIIAALANNKACPSKILEAIASFTSEGQTLEAISKHPHSNPEVIISISLKNPNLGVLPYVAQMISKPGDFKLLLSHHGMQTITSLVDDVYLALFNNPDFNDADDINNILDKTQNSAVIKQALKNKSALITTATLRTLAESRALDGESMDMIARNDSVSGETLLEIVKKADSSELIESIYAKYRNLCKSEATLETESIYEPIIKNPNSYGRILIHCASQTENNHLLTLLLNHKNLATTNEHYIAIIKNDAVTIDLIRTILEKTKDAAVIKTILEERIDLLGANELKEIANYVATDQVNLINSKIITLEFENDKDELKNPNPEIAYYLSQKITKKEDAQRLLSYIAKQNRAQSLAEDIYLSLYHNPHVVDSEILNIILHKTQNHSIIKDALSTKQKLITDEIRSYLAKSKLIDDDDRLQIAKHGSISRETLIDMISQTKSPELINNLCETYFPLWHDNFDSIFEQIIKNEYCAPCTLKYIAIHTQKDALFIPLLAHNNFTPTAESFKAIIENNVVTPNTIHTIYTKTAIPAVINTILEKRMAMLTAAELTQIAQNISEDKVHLIINQIENPIFAPDKDNILQRLIENKNVNNIETLNSIIDKADDKKNIIKNILKYKNLYLDNPKASLLGLKFAANTCTQQDAEKILKLLQNMSNKKEEILMELAKNKNIKNASFIRSMVSQAKSQEAQKFIVKQKKYNLYLDNLPDVIKALENNHVRLKNKYKYKYKNKEIITASETLIKNLREAFAMPEEKMPEHCLSAIERAKQTFSKHRSNRFVQFIQAILHQLSKLFSADYNKKSEMHATFFYQSKKLTSSAQALYDASNILDADSPATLNITSQ
jgi:hypothetical protein